MKKKRIQLSLIVLKLVNRSELTFRMKSRPVTKKKVPLMKTFKVINRKDLQFLVAACQIREEESLLNRSITVVSRVKLISRMLFEYVFYFFDFMYPFQIMEQAANQMVQNSLAITNLLTTAVLLTFVPKNTEHRH